MAKPVTQKIDKFLRSMRQKRLLEYDANAATAYGRKGLADRRVYSYSITWFLEIKEEGDTESPAQEDRRKRLTELMFHWVQVEPHNVDGVIAVMKERIYEMKAQADMYASMEEESNLRLPTKH
jgi:hypothetical protein